MLRYGLRNVTLIAGLALTVPAAAHAQAFLYGGGGVAFGVGDIGDATDVGWMGLVGVGFPVSDGGIGIGVEGLYGSLSGSESSDPVPEPFASGADVDIWGVLGTVGIVFGDEGGVRPYVYGGAGIIGTNVDVDDPLVPTPLGDGSDSSFGYEGVAGLDIPVGGGNVSLFVEGRYMGSSDVNVIGLVGGVSIGLGG